MLIGHCRIDTGEGNISLHSIIFKSESLWRGHGVGEVSRPGVGCFLVGGTALDEWSAGRWCGLPALVGLIL